MNTQDHDTGPDIGRDTDTSQTSGTSQSSVTGQHGVTGHHGVTGQGGGPDSAAGRAERGSAGWEDAVRLQRWATPDHADFYALAGEIVTTLYALDELAQVLHRQVSRYGLGRRLYDDTRQVDPGARLVEATTELAALRERLQAAQAPANRFWSMIGHIGVEPPNPTPGEVTR